MTEGVDGCQQDAGSFRDPTGHVYRSCNRIYRGMDETAAAYLPELFNEAFFQDFITKKEIVHSDILSDKLRAELSSLNHWAIVLEHELIPFISYPYEWSFSMLKDAALLQLEILETSLENGWTLKDVTPYNIQWANGKPVFIDIGSFEPWEDGEPWFGYRQFCSMFLYPLMLRAHKKIDHLPILRTYLDGIPPQEIRKIFHGMSVMKKGVLSHIVLPAKIESSIENQEKDAVPAKKRERKQSKAMVIGLVQSMARLIRSLKLDISHTDWSHYDKNHSYEMGDLEQKKSFVEHYSQSEKLDVVWDIGCNTGSFSKIVSPFAKKVISLDADHDSIEQLYISIKNEPETNILPLVMNLANPSPAQGWQGKERKTLEMRGKPDLVLCLALVHHIRMTANIPLPQFIEWLATLDTALIIEFVNRTDDMVIKLLTNKKEQYKDYNREDFEKSLKKHFSIEDFKSLKDGHRIIYYARPLNV